MKKTKYIIPILSITMFTPIATTLIGCSCGGDQGKTVSALVVTNNASPFAVGTIIKASDIIVKTKIGEIISETPLVWGSGYSIAKKDGSVIDNFDTAGYTFTADDVTAGSVSFVITYLAKTSITSELTINSVKAFKDTDLADIISAINTFEASKQDEAAMKKLCSTFADTAYVQDISSEITDPNRQIEAHLANFIGKTNTAKINDKNHTIRVIGINHDRLSSSIAENPKYAAFTFEMVTLLSDGEGNALTSNWDVKGNNYDYLNSTLRKNLTGNGNGTLQWYKTDHSTASEETKTAFQMLSPELQSVIKTVNKKVATYDGTEPFSSEHYEVKDEGYDDKLFILTRNEVAHLASKEEGFSYKFWEDTSKKSYEELIAARKKGDVNNSVQNAVYLLLSPVTNLNNEVTVAFPGGYDTGIVDYPKYLTFCFCI